MRGKAPKVNIYHSVFSDNVVVASVVVNSTSKNTKKL